MGTPASELQIEDTGRQMRDDFSAISARVAQDHLKTVFVNCITYSIIH